MQHQSPKEWFFQSLARDAFTIYSITWLFLFLLENVKTGVVSNYLSLPHALLPLFFLGVLWMALTPEFEQQAIVEKKPFPYLMMMILSLITLVVLSFIVDASLVLTALIIFATLAALWAGAYTYYKHP